MLACLVLVLVACLFIYRLDENVAESTRKENTSNSKNPSTLLSKASYFTELAFIYIYFDHLKYFKSSDVFKNISFTKT